MSEDLHNIDDLFKRALDDNEEEPSKGVWENIDRKLDKSSVININRKYRRVQWVAAASLIMVCALGMYTLYKTKFDKQYVVEEKNKKTGIGDKISETGKPVERSTPTQNEEIKEERPKQKVAPKQEVERRDFDSAAHHKKLGKDQLTSDKKSVSNEKGISKKNRLFTRTHRQNLVLNEKKRNGQIMQKTLINKKASESSPVNQFATKKNTSTNDLSFKNNLSKSHTVNSLKDSSALREPSMVLKEEISTLLAAAIDRKSLLETGSIKKLNDRGILPLNSIPAVGVETNVEIDKNIRPKISGSSFSTTVFFSPDFVKAKVQIDQPQYREDDRRGIEQTEKTKSSFTVGVLTNYSFNKNWSIVAGLTYFTRGTDVEAKTIYARPDKRGNVKYRFNSSVGYGYVTLKSTANTPARPLRSGDSVRTISSTSTLNYVGVPLAVKYNIVMGRLMLDPSAGVSVNFLTRGSVETSIATANGGERVRITDIEGLKSTYLNGFFGLGASYKINRTFALILIPTTRFGLTSINREAPVKTYLNSFGLVAGLNINL